MRASSFVAPLAVLCLALGATPDAAQAQGSPELAGGWIVTSWTSPDGEMNTQPQRGLFVFTESGHYSIMHVNGSEPRAQFSESSTEADRLAAYDAITANSGRYRVAGNVITYEAYVAKHPNYMAGFMTEEGNAVTMTYAIEDGILTLEWTSGNGAGRKATLRRPGQRN
jgi:hypothetical protein